MRARYAKELTEGCHVESNFILRSREVRIARNGDAYLSMRLADRSGVISAVCFRPTAVAAAIPAGVVVSVAGRVESYRCRRMLVLDHLLPATDWDSAELVSDSLRPAGELQLEFGELVKSVRDRDMRRVLDSVFRDKATYAAFCVCPATESDHHSFLRGLMEHTVAVARLCASMAAEYPQCDRDLLITAALLHDIGCLDELQWEAGIRVTDRGRLIGHEMLGQQRLGAVLAKSGMETCRAARLEHALAMHHRADDLGGSTLEAMLLHRADELDVSVSILQARSRDTCSDESWTARLSAVPLSA